MGACEHGFAVAGAAVNGDDVLDPRTARKTLDGTALEGSLHFGRVTHRLQFGHDAVAHDGVRADPAMCGVCSFNKADKVANACGSENAVAAAPAAN